MPLYYTDIDIKPDHAIYDAVSEIVRCVHHHNVNRVNQDRIALAFPDYREGEATSTRTATSYGEEQGLIGLRQGHLGSLVRVFGEQAALQQFLAPHGARSLYYNNALSWSPPDLVSGAVTAWCSFVRYTDRERDSKLRRALKRRAEGKTRPHPDEPWLSDEELETRSVTLRRKAREDRTHPFVRAISSSNGSKFSLFIERRMMMQPNYSPDNYGFSTRTNICALPVF